MARERSREERHQRRRKTSSPASTAPNQYDSSMRSRARSRESAYGREPSDSSRNRGKKYEDRHRLRYRNHSRSRSPKQDRKIQGDRSVDKLYRSRHKEAGEDDRHKHRSRDAPGRRSISADKRRSKQPLPSQADAFNGETAMVKRSPLPEKQKPNFGITGRLAAESNTITSVDGQTVVLKYHEPPEARKPAPKDAWRMYVFKESEIVDTVELGQRSCWLFGREHAVADFPIEHPSCSKQHAVIQFRYVEKRTEYGDKSGKVRPYIIDLESANGTEVNVEAMPAGRYIELRDKDVIKFGLSSREYVLMLPPPG